MTRYLLDSNELINFARGREPFAIRIRDLLESGEEVGVSPVCVAEFLSNLPPERRSRWIDLLLGLTVWPLSFEDGVQAGIYRYEAARSGRPLSTPDTLIAATAHRVNAIVVTENLKDFPMPGVRVMSLAEG
ncbi:MAG: PIN domain-containing protein [Dehalococcoidia bacterium]|nr:PIN domain-containing protein [Dehalococcoidia bacterium]